MPLVPGVSDHLVRRWNWGASLLPWLWPFWHGVPWIGIAGILCLLLSPWIVPALAGIALTIYLGVKGGSIAAHHRAYADDDDYRRVENAWTVGGVIALIASVPTAMACIFIGYLIGAITTPLR